MRRPFLIVLLALGTVGGYSAGFRSMRHRWSGHSCGDRWSQRYDDPRYDYGRYDRYDSYRDSARASEQRAAPAPAQVAPVAPQVAPAQPMVVIVPIQSGAAVPAPQVLPIQVAPYAAPVQVAPGIPAAANPTPAP